MTVITFTYGTRTKTRRLESRDASGAWVLTEGDNRLFVPAEDILDTPEFAAITALWTPEEQRRADDVVWVHENRAKMHKLPRPGEWVWKREQADAKNRREHDQAVVQAEFQRHAEQRARRWQELDAWAKRQSVITEFGSGAALQPNWFKWLKAIDKRMPTKKATKGWRRFEELTYPTRETIPIFDALTLDFADNRMTAYFWSVDDDGFALNTFRERLDCRVDAPFTARVDFEALYGVIDLMPKERVDFRFRDGALELSSPGNLNRLKHIPIHPLTTAYWLGFPPDPNADSAALPKAKKKRGRQKS